MPEKDSGFTMLELLLTVAILGIIAAFAIPSAMNSLQAYRLHADSTGVASFMNVARMRAASQYAPYALDVDDTITPPTYVIEQLQNTVYNPLSPSAVSYASQSPQVYELGTQYAASSTTLSECRPAGITVFPGSITADPSTCSGPFQFCFNTRGYPVQCSGGAAGTPLTNGGAALYLTNQNGMTDAITVAVGGVIQAWNWDANTSKWYVR